LLGKLFCSNKKINKKIVAFSPQIHHHQIDYATAVPGACVSVRQSRETGLTAPCLSPPAAQIRSQVQSADRVVVSLLSLSL
jgi:hypothetical protein